MVILSQVRLQTFRLELGDAIARATVSAFVLTVRLAAHVTDTLTITVNKTTSKTFYPTTCSAAKHVGLLFL